MSTTALLAIIGLIAIIFVIAIDLRTKKNGTKQVPFDHIPPEREWWLERGVEAKTFNFLVSGKEVADLGIEKNGPQ